MKLRNLLMAVGIAITASSYASANSLALTDTMDLGSFDVSQIYGDVFSVASQGAIDHTLTFTILSDLYAGSGIANVPLGVSTGSFTLEFTNITGLNADILDSNGDLYTSFLSTGSPNYLTLAANSFFAAGDYSLKVTGTATGTGNPAGLYVIAAVTAPVPEPQAWALLLAGTGLIGLRARRRQGRPAMMR